VEVAVSERASGSKLKDPVQRHLVGRRTEHRVPLKYGVECQGVSGRHDGELIDLSRHGALLTFLNPAFQAADDLALVATAKRLCQEFKTRMLLRFQGRTVALNAKLVRTTRDQRARRTVVACTFDRALSVRECRLLRVRLLDPNHQP
jgi:hypothetical protein